MLILSACLKRKKPTPNQLGLPTVRFVFACCREGKRLEAKIANIKNFNYPANKLQIIAVSDDADKETLNVLKKAENQRELILLENPRRLGKVAALAKALKGCDSDIFVVTDADTLLEPDDLIKLVTPFQNQQVSATTGIIRYVNIGETGISKSQGIYWKFEILTRRIESITGNLIGLTGAVYAIRPKLFNPHDPRFADDLLAALQAREKGGKVYLIEEISGRDFSPTTSGYMYKRRVRMMTQAMGLIFNNLKYLNPFRHSLLAFQVWSHKVLRWMYPWFMLGMLITNIILANAPLWQGILVSQITFYALGLVGGIASMYGKKILLASSVWYFLLSGTASIIALVNVIRGKHFATWEETARR